ncbi:MAG: hypothetical protein ABEJ02_03805 [Candidatus Paceibacteria bacterium]
MSTESGQSSPASERRGENDREPLAGERSVRDGNGGDNDGISGEAPAGPQVVDDSSDEELGVSKPEQGDEERGGSNNEAES